MSSNRFLPLTCWLLLLAGHIVAQPTCGFDIVHKAHMEKDAAYRQHVLSGESAIREYLSRHPQLGKSKSPVIQSNPFQPNSNPSTLSALYIIPVVVHVIHTGGPVGSIYNPTDAQILGALDYLNAVYNGSWPGTVGVRDLQIQFAIAKRDPNCNPTNGINRVDGSAVTDYISRGVRLTSSGPGADELQVKGLSRWDPSQYYNIWIVDKIEGNDGTSGQFVAGYAYFPGSDPNLDGTVMLATQMIAGQKTLPHEVGHAFNLYHPFQGSSDLTTCPLNTNCSVYGDQVCDTDPITENITDGILDPTCRTGLFNPCTGTPFNIATESNYMNYTNCYALFTNGQKVRMLASAASVYRASLSSSLGATAPNDPAHACGPKINFEFSGDQVKESPGGADGCRAYRDHTYKMVIGDAPTADARVTLTHSGNAVPGVDYDLTTNGNFATPSNTLTFPAGSMASQSFTIRVYDDASVNGTRHALIGFTLAAGPGNAIAGDGRPQFKLTVRDNDAPPSPGLLPTGTAPVGTVSFGYTAMPFNAALSAQRSQFMYRASELQAAGVPAGPITGITLQVNSKFSVRPYTNFNINIGTAGGNYLVDNGVLVLGSSMTTVLALPSYTTANGLNTFTFDTPYIWDGTSNIVVELCYDNGGVASDNGDQLVFYNDGATGSQSNSIVENSISCSQSFSTVSYIVLNGEGVKPRIIFNYGVPPTPVRTQLNSSMQQYLGPHADIYFYDQASHELMARIHNLTAFDYGCTQLVIDRSGTATTPFWNSNSTNYLMNKTFKVIPANNNPAGSYEITLYYTKSEVDGWQTATGKNISAIQLIKVAGQVSDVTPANPSGGGAVVIGNPMHSALGPSTALTYNFTTGFSGFGAGIPDMSPLPLGLVDFTGRWQRGQVDLRWSTSFESSTSRFGIERSYDGNAYTNIGYVQAAGNSNTRKEYVFNDPLAAGMKIYYRLREIDLDDTYAYSKVLLLNADGSPIPISVSPSPFTNASGLDIRFGQLPLGRCRLRLLDLTGKELLRRENGQAGPDGRLHLDVSGLSLSAGVYLLEVSTNNATTIVKVIRE